jgi:hypothetical protein
LFLLERLISRSCRSLAVMIGCGQRIRAFAGSNEDADAERARRAVPPGTTATPHCPRRFRFRPCLPAGRRVPPALKGGPRWIDASS